MERELSGPDGGAVVEVAIERIRTHIPIRGEGENTEHTAVLQQRGDDLPPILVHRATMTVIDGFHRLQAARRRGAERIGVRFFDGDENEAFVLAIRHNSGHGLPLTLADRKAAARKLVGLYPDWSDRRISEVAGLSHKTVGAMRRTSGEIPQTLSRVGRDGRVRRLAQRNSAPGAVARLRVGAAPAEAAPPDRATVMNKLRSDPSLRLTDAGRALLRWLDAGPWGTEDVSDLVGRIPEHCVSPVIALANGNAMRWKDLVDRLQARVKDTSHRDSA